MCTSWHIWWQGWVLFGSRAHPSWDLDWAVSNLLCTVHCGPNTDLRPQQLCSPPGCYRKLTFHQTNLTRRYWFGFVCVSLESAVHFEQPYPIVKPIFCQSNKLRFCQLIVFTWERRQLHHIGKNKIGRELSHRIQFCFIHVCSKFLNLDERFLILSFQGLLAQVSGLLEPF